MISRNLRFLLLLTSAFSFSASYGGNPNEAPVPKLKKTIRGEVQLPRPLWNKAFEKNFSGVFNAGLSMNWGGKHFNMGGFYSLTQYQIFPGFLKPADTPHSILTNHTTGIKCFYDVLSSSGNGMFSPYISAGYTFMSYTRVQCKKQMPHNTKTGGISMNAGAVYNIMMDEWVGVGFTVGYNVIDHVFNPTNICLDEYMDFTNKERKGSLQNIFFGFSLYFDLAKKPEGQ